MIYLGDGSLDGHGVNPRHGGMSSVLEAGRCKAEMRFREGSNQAAQRMNKKTQNLVESVKY